MALSGPTVGPAARPDLSILQLLENKDDHKILEMEIIIPVLFQPLGSLMGKLLNGC